MRVIALDVGDRRIGVALSDPTGLLASPLSTVTRKGHDADVDEVLGLAAANDVAEIVVGMPVSLSGRKGAQAARTTAFAEELRRKTDLPVVFVDERYSTVQAERSLRELGVQPSRDRARVDAAAAAVILQSYLDSKRAKDS
ncbi:MAG: Holliday junction resolvase RuvX [Chloroflexi bacterium]|nr:Holliday junction resolvase RuvX [Chloroflexota bacterium]